MNIIKWVLIVCAVFGGASMLVLVALAWANSASLGAVATVFSCAVVGAPLSIVYTEMMERKRHD